MSIASFIDEVESAIASGDTARRSGALREVTKLFVAQSPALSQAQVNVFDEVISRLARDIEFKARVELSENVADVQKAPRQVVRQLAFDHDIAVAGPVIERSNGLDDNDLVTIGQERGQEFLLAMSQRPSLSEKVTDVIVDRGNDQVVRRVAGNDGARFSQHGFDQLLEKARGDDTLPLILKARADIPSNHMATLVQIAREKARETLSAEGASDEAIDAAVSRISELISSDASDALLDNFRDASRRVYLKAASKGLGEPDIVEWLHERKLVEALAALAHLARVEPAVVSRAYFAAHYDPLLYLVRSVRLSWNCFKMLLAAKLGHEPPEDLLKSAFQSYQALSVPTAQRVVRFVSARDKISPPKAA
jgi:uncharacterized protein (DUF2336 family)